MYNVLDVAQYIANYSFDKGYFVNYMKLQRLLYFVQAYFVSDVGNSIPCFYSDIIASKYGATIKEVREEYRKFACMGIPKLINRRIYKENGPWYGELVPIPFDEISSKDKESINKVVDYFCNYTDTSLITIIKNQTPWKMAMRHKDQVIDLDVMREYFR